FPPTSRLKVSDRSEKDAMLKWTAMKDQWGKVPDASAIQFWLDRLKPVFLRVIGTPAGLGSFGLQRTEPLHTRSTLSNQRLPKCHPVCQYPRLCHRNHATWPTKELDPI